MSRLPVSGVWLRRALVAAVLVGFIVFHDRFPDLDLEQIIKDLSQGLGSWTYLLVAALAFLETGAFVGLIAPGEFTVLLGGAVAGQGDVSLPLLLAITWLSAFLGDTVSFLLGARLGRGFLVRHGERVRITEARLKQVEDYFASHGGKTIVIGRFIGLVRALAPFIAGTSKMPYGSFAPYSVLGTGLWATTFILIGYFASQSLDKVAAVVGRGLLGFGIFVGFVVGCVVVVQHLRVPANRARLVAGMERRPLLRPGLAAARRLRPQAAFLWQRLTPGGLGLELTTLTAALSVGLFVLISYWSVVGADPGPTGGDTAALELADDLRTAWLDDAAELVTFFGSGFVVFPLAALAALALGLGRRWPEFWVVVVGTAVTFVGVHEIKDWTDRPRPPGGLVDAGGSSFPSGHAAYSTLYTWLAVTLALRIVPGLGPRALVITAGVVVTAVIGLTRVYLRVHWLSDVSAGWALGFSALSAAAIVALVSSHMRDNSGLDDSQPDRSRGAPAGAGH